MISERQEKLLDLLVAEYVSTAAPISSKALKEKSGLDCCEATIRNDLQCLTEKGYIEQPHTSAGRVPTQKAYKYIADRLETSTGFVAKISIVRQVEFTRGEMEREMKLMEELMQTLEDDNLFEILNILDQWRKKMTN